MCGRRGDNFCNTSFTGLHAMRDINGKDEMKLSLFLFSFYIKSDVIVYGCKHAFSFIYQKYTWEKRALWYAICKLVNARHCVTSVAARRIHAMATSFLMPGLFPGHKSGFGEDEMGLCCLPLGSVIYLSLGPCLGPCLVLGPVIHLSSIRQPHRLEHGRPCKCRFRSSRPSATYRGVA